MTLLRKKQSSLHQKSPAEQKSNAMERTKEYLTTIKVRCDNYGSHIVGTGRKAMPYMKFIGWDTAGRGYAIYACPICNWRKGYWFTKEQRIVKIFG